MRLQTIAENIYDKMLQDSTLTFERAFEGLDLSDKDKEHVKDLIIELDEHTNGLGV